MEDTASDYFCLSCKTYDQGKYCSQCGALLPIDINQLPDLLTARLIKMGYEVFDKGEISTNLNINSRKFFQYLEEMFDTMLLRLDMLGQAGYVTIIGLTNLNVNKTREWNEIFSEIQQAIPQQAFSIGDKKVKVLEVKIYQIGEITDKNNIRKPKASLSLSYGRRIIARLQSKVIWYLQGFEIHPEQLFIAGNDWTDIDHNQFVFSLKQLNIHQRNNQSKSESTLREITQVAYAKTVKEIYKFALNWYRLSSRPFFTATRIRTREMSGIDVLTFLLGSYAFGKILSEFIGYKPPSVDIYPIVDDLMNFLVILAVTVFWALILHPCFKVCHGKGKLRDTLLGLALVTGLIVPILSIVNAVAWKFIGPDALNNVNFGGGVTVYSIPVFAAMHQMTPRKTALVLMFVPLVFILAIGGLVFIVLMLTEIAFSNSLIPS